MYNMSLLFISHDLALVSQICEKVYVMYKGSIVENGSIEQVFGSPQHDYTKALFAAAPGREWEFGTFQTAS